MVFAKVSLFVTNEFTDFSIKKYWFLFNTWRRAGFSTTLVLISWVELKDSFSTCPIKLVHNS